jgi:hypothetical protein
MLRGMSAPVVHEGQVSKGSSPERGARGREAYLCLTDGGYVLDLLNHLALLVFGGLHCEGEI